MLQGGGNIQTRIRRTSKPGARRREKVYEMLGTEREYGCSWSKVPRKIGDGLVRMEGTDSEIMKGLIHCVK